MAKRMISQEDVNLIIGTVITANLATIGTALKYIIKKEKELTEIQTTLKEVQKDVDAIALIIGTPRAIAQQSNEKSE